MSVSMSRAGGGERVAVMFHSFAVNDGGERRWALSTVPGCDVGPHQGAHLVLVPRLDQGPSTGEAF
jgi:hypothetical protein